MLPFELADPDVVQVGIDDVRNVRRAAAEREARGLLRPGEARGDAEVDRDAGQLHAERLRGGPAGVRQAPVERGIAVHEPETLKTD